MITNHCSKKKEKVFNRSVVVWAESANENATWAQANACPDQSRDRDHARRIHLQIGEVENRVCAWEVGRDGPYLYPLESPPSVFQGALRGHAQAERPSFPSSAHLHPSHGQEVQADSADARTSNHLRPHESRRLRDRRY